MKCLLKYLGYTSVGDRHFVYSILTETGHADRIYDSAFVSATEVDLPDYLWQSGSGWATVRCDDCGYIFRERTAVGYAVKCPVCGTLQHIPIDAKLDDTY
jgi:phage FluMu protein Com